MKMILIILLVFLYSLGTMAAVDAKKICDQGSASSSVKSNWKKIDRTSPMGEDRWCAEVNCSTNGKTLVRTMCVRGERGAENLIIVSYNDVISAPSFSTTGRFDRMFINKDEPCLQSCLPAKKMFKIVAGIERKECLECFQNKTNSPVSDLVINYPEIGRPLHRGSKCYNLCQDKTGPIVTERVLTTECQQCVGINGLVAESFEYLLNKDDKCYEVDTAETARPVDRSFCAPNDKLILTEYESQSGLFSFITQEAPKCYELDDKTWGSIYKVQRPADKCATVNVNNTDRQTDPTKSNGASPASGTSSGSSKQ